MKMNIEVDIPVGAYCTGCIFKEGFDGYYCVLDPNKAELQNECDVCGTDSCVGCSVRNPDAHFKLDSCPGNKRNLS